MQTNADRGRSALAHGLLVTAMSILFAFWYPALNWPDEFRNVSLVTAGDYGVFYGRYVNFIVALLSTAPVQETGGVAAARHVVLSNSNFAMVDGGLRYLSEGSIPWPYYAGKIANILLVVVFMSGMALYLIRRRCGRAVDFHVFMLSLAFPAVSYGMMQISTDLPFILACLPAFFLRSRWMAISYAIALLPLVFEDRSFVFLSGFILGREALKTLFAGRLNSAGTWPRIAIIVLTYLSCAAAGIFIHDYLLGSDIYAANLGGSVSQALEYTSGKSFDRLTSLVVLYAGLVVLPGATEFFIKMVPIYLVAGWFFYKFMRFCLRKGPESDETYAAVVATVAVFALVTNATHVFESGRYYLYLIPYIIQANIAKNAEATIVSAKRIAVMVVFSLGVCLEVIFLAQLSNV